MPTTKVLCGVELWREISNKSKAAADGTRKAAIAYVTSSKQITFQNGDILFVDASDDAIRSGRTSAGVLEEFLNCGAKLYCYAGLHAKIYVLDEHTIVGSANASNNSANGNLFEAAMISDDPEVAEQAVQLLEGLVKQSTVIDATFITRLKDVPVCEGAPKKALSLGDDELIRMRGPVTVSVQSGDQKQAIVFTKEEGISQKNWREDLEAMATVFLSRKLSEVSVDVVWRHVLASDQHFGANHDKVGRITVKEGALKELIRTEAATQELRRDATFVLLLNGARLEIDDLPANPSSPQLNRPR